MAGANRFPGAEDEEIFELALVLPTGQRGAYLREACEGRLEMLARIERLLASLDEGGFMAVPADRTSSEDAEASLARLKREETGDRIGPYTLLEPLGEGGFGTVWLAQEERPVKRQVALKIIKPGMDTREVLARFEQERQALALMEHSNIAKVFGGGATPAGRPFFVMELVRGVRITDYCDQNHLPIEERLKLFVQVCQAVQHAHQKGIIHRDLKPSNILVTVHDAVPVPKVIDFGVAKATQQRLTDLTFLTQLEQMIGTPPYMAPEQAAQSGHDVDTRSDIYSLGVLLYELLTGRTPFERDEFLKAGLGAIRRVISESEPRKPSTLLSTMAADLRTSVARHRHSEAARLITRIRGDLDWIVMKALEKDRNRRYETASGFAKDIQRHLTNEPVLARPPSRLYRSQRFVRRNKAGFGAAMAVAVALIIGLAASVSQSMRAAREADRANNEADRTRAALADLQAAAPAFAEQAQALVQKQRFGEAIEKLEYAAKLRPDLAEYLVAKGDLLQCQLRLHEAAEAFRSALLLNREHAHARANAALCEKLLADRNSSLKFSRENLSELYAAMQREQRPAAQLLPLARQLGEEKQLLLAVWMERLKNLPIPAERPLKERLSMREDGLLSLDLSGTKVADLTALEGMPLGELDCTGCAAVVDLGPVAGMPLKHLRLSNTAVHDVAPLGQLHTLETLDLSGTKVSNLGALRGLQLRALNLSHLAAHDLSVLSGMPLEQLDISHTRVRDLSPLAGLPLKRLSCDSIPAIQFAPLADLPLEFFSLRHTRCYDVAFLKKMPLRELFLTGCFAGNSKVLPEIQTLEVIALPERWRVVPELGVPVLRNHPRLQRIGFELVDRPLASELPTVAEFWRSWDREGLVAEKFRATGVQVRIKVLPDQTWEVSLDSQPVKDLSPLRGAPVSRLLLRDTPISDLNQVAGMWLKALSIRGTRVSDLSPLIGMPLEELELIGTAINDLGPLQGMPLRRLSFEGTEVADLSPLRGMSLQELWMGTTQVADLSPLKGMPIHLLHIDDCPRLTDLSPLLEVPALEQVFLPKTARNVELLRTLPSLKFISYEINRDTDQLKHTTEEFWSMTKPTMEVGLFREKRFAELERIIRSQIDSSRSTRIGTDYLKLVAIALTTRNRDRYRELCAEMLERPPGIDSLSIINAGCWTQETGITDEQMRYALNDLKSAYGDAPDLRGVVSVTYALCEYRLGLWDQAARRIELIAKPRTVRETAIARALLAMTRFRLGDLQAARSELQDARGLAEECCPGAKPWAQAGPDADFWHECLMIHLLVQEAEKLVGDPAASPISK